MDEGHNGEFAQKLIEAVETFAGLDGAFDKVRERQICDAVGVKCDLSCKVYVKKERLLKFIEECIKAAPPALAVEARPESEEIPHAESALIPEPVKI